MNRKLLGLTAMLTPFALALAVAVGAAGAGVLTPASSVICAPPSGEADAHVDGLSSVQLGNARIVHNVSVQMGLPQRAAVIAIATALQESDLHNLGHLGAANDHDSLGLFQQRPSQGWGSPEQIMNPVYASAKFYQNLISIAGWEHLPLTIAAQTVQRSAFPNAYAKHESHAAAVVAGVASKGSWAIPGDLEQCVSNAGWTHPLPGYKVNSAVRTAERPSHDGVDIAAPKGTPIRAAASGVVIKVRCNASLNGGDYSCDVDGSPAVAGCGHYLQIRTGSYIHRYCHLLRKPMVLVGQAVQAGQFIGFVGSSGNSSGPHLHWELHRGSEASPRTAVDPVTVMRQFGVAGF